MKKTEYWETYRVMHLDDAIETAIELLSKEWSDFWLYDSHGWPSKINGRETHKTRGDVFFDIASAYPEQLLASIDDGEFKTTDEFWIFTTDGEIISTDEIELREVLFQMIENGIFEGWLTDDEVWEAMEL